MVSRYQNLLDSKDLSTNRIHLLVGHHIDGSQSRAVEDAVVAVQDLVIQTTDSLLYKIDPQALQYLSDVLQVVLLVYDEGAEGVSFGVLLGQTHAVQLFLAERREVVHNITPRWSFVILMLF